MKVVLIAIYSNRKSIKLSRGISYEDKKEMFLKVRWFLHQGSLKDVNCYDRDTGKFLEKLYHDKS